MNLIPNDYTRCINDKCTKKNNCKRYLQALRDTQPVSVAVFKQDKSENCDYYLPLMRIVK